MNATGKERNKLDDYNSYDISYEGNSIIEENHHDENDSGLSDSFINSLHEGFLGSKQITADASMNYSNTNTSKLNMFSQRSLCPPKPSTGQLLKHPNEGEDEVISLNQRSAVMLGQLEAAIQGYEYSFDSHHEEVISQWKSMVLNQMEFYRSELAKFIEETECQTYQYQSIAHYYKDKLDKHLAQCECHSSEELNRIAGVLQRKEQELEEQLRRIEVESAFEGLVGQVERNEKERKEKESQEKLERMIQAHGKVENELREQCQLYEKRIEEMTAGQEQRLDELNQKIAKQGKEMAQLKAKEIAFKRKDQELMDKIGDMEKQLKEKDEVKIELEKQAQELRGNLERLKEDNSNIQNVSESEKDSKNNEIIEQLEATRKEIDLKNELICKLKRTLQRERFQRNAQAPTVLIKRSITPMSGIRENNDDSNQVQNEEGQQKNSLEEREMGQNLNHQKSLVKRKTKSIDLTTKQSSSSSRLMNISFQSGCDQSQSICMDNSCAGQNNSIIGLEEKKIKRRSVSMMNSSMLVSNSQEDPNIPSRVSEDRILLVRELKEVQRKREDIKERIKTAQSEFEQTQKRKITKQEQKPWQELIDQYKVLSELMKEVDEKIVQFDQQSLQLQANSQDIHFASTSNQNQDGNSHNNMHNQSTLVDSQICKQINNSTISDISNNTTSTIRQPIFKSTNPLFTKHLGFSSSSYTHNSLMIDHNHQNTLLHNISANLADSSQILSQSVANASTATSHISHKSSTLSGDADIAKGLRLEIKNLQHANNLLREKLLNSKSSHEYEQEIKSKESKIEQLMSDIALIAQQRNASEERVEEMKDTIDILTVKLQSETKERRVLHNIVEDMKGKIRVFCRVRPPSENELANGSPMIVDIQDNMTIQLQTKNGPKKFSFDSCLESTQGEIFEDTKRLIQSAVDGYNVCIFAYGQTGSGKTYTMQGNQDEPGIVPRSIAELFNLLKPIQKSCRVNVSTYIVELYQDTIIDLLNPQPRELYNKKLEIKEDQITGNTYIANVNIDQVTTKDELEQLVYKSTQLRRVSRTDMNTESSRSHLIITILLSIYNPQTETTSHGKISLIDLAGSERIHKSGANAVQIKEAQAINKSLTALGDVISALTSAPQQGQERFVPYRNNKLTYLMKDSLGGNAKTLMFVNISPSEFNSEETQSSLFYASRVKNIVNDSVKNIETKEQIRLKDMLSVLSSENEKLQQQLSNQQNISKQQQQLQQQQQLHLVSQLHSGVSQPPHQQHIQQSQSYQNNPPNQHPSKQPFGIFSSNLKSNIPDDDLIPKTYFPSKTPNNTQQQSSALNPPKQIQIVGRSTSSSSSHNPSSRFSPIGQMNQQTSQQINNQIQICMQPSQKQESPQQIIISQKENTLPQARSISQTPLGENRNFMNQVKSSIQHISNSSRPELNKDKY